MGAPCNDCLLERAFGNITFGSLNSIALDGTDIQPWAQGEAPWLRELPAQICIGSSLLDSIMTRKAAHHFSGPAKRFCGLKQRDAVLIPSTALELGALVVVCLTWTSIPAGIRNTVGFDWNANDTLYFTNNGIDQLGNDRPDDTLNVAPRPGLFFGFPYCHA